MKLKLVHVLVALGLAGVLGFGGVSLASAQDTTSTTVQDGATTTTPDNSSGTTTAPDDSQSGTPAPSTQSNPNCPNMGGSSGSSSNSSSGATTSSFRAAASGYRSL
jgi:hypothetical protein